MRSQKSSSFKSKSNKPLIGRRATGKFALPGVEIEGFDEDPVEEVKQLAPSEIAVAKSRQKYLF